ncbi:MULTISPECIES: DUF3644 domain-containing protein [Rhodomicrobium]|uniref:DUF3644 domain-containing protein n=1 Tax=Rhodomicrobium TaxID=1068 RepID=UPI000F7496A2|nr:MULTISPECIES: DUF3644 domain-containing protein [Rhodomicrobium]
MVKRQKDGSLTSDEKRAVKALIAEGMRNQDIQDLVNRGRRATINSARITEVKQNEEQEAASESELELFKIKRKLYDPVTGLNDIDHERLIRAREAMMMAVHIFNSPHLKFRTELFAVLANISWTYLLHEYHENILKEDIYRSDGTTVSLHEILSRKTCPLSKYMRKNLDSIKEIRDEVEHRLFGKSDTNWLGIFQACCVNFENKMCDLFGKDLSLQASLRFSLQFARVSLSQISETQELAIPANIQSLDARLNSDFDEGDPASLEYKFRVVYTLDSSSKSGSNIRFVNPGTEEGVEIHNILVKTKNFDELYPFKPAVVVQLVKEKVKQFSSHTHQLAWKRHKARPRNGVKKPHDTDKTYCIYNSVYCGYTYSQKWVDFLIQTYQEIDELNKLRAGTT